MAKLYPDWLAVRVETGKEISINAHILRRGLNTFLPTCKVKSRWSDRIKILEHALFDGYLFSHIFPWESELLVRTPGVISILSLRGEHIIMDPSEIEALRGRTDEKGSLVVTALKVGDQAQIKSGGFAGHCGQIEKLSTDDLVARIRLKIFGKTWHIETSPYDLQVVTA